MTARSGGRATRLLTACVVLLPAACGIPADDTPVVIATIPYELASPSPVPGRKPTPNGGERPFVFLLTRTGFLAAVEVRTQTLDTAERLTEVMSRLTIGPTDAERAAGWSSALGPEDTVRLRGVEGTEAQIELVLGDQAISAGQLPLAVGQVVLTATSVPGVRSVVLFDEADRIEAPLPGGAQTSDALVSADYAKLIAEDATPSPTTTPSR